MVTQGITPAVPINLSDVVRALVQGWKENGDWPPRGYLEADAGVTRGRLGADGSGRKGLMGGDGAGAGAAKGVSITADEKGFSAEGKLLGKSTTTGLAKRGVGRMKKALGLGTEEKDKTDGGDADQPASMASPEP